jgi:phage head maturation protease
MDERLYLTTLIPYGEVSYGTDNPRGEQLAPSSLRHIPGHPPRLYLAHGGDRARYRIPAGKLWEASDQPDGLRLVYELHRTEEGRRAAENSADSTPGCSVEMVVLRDHTGTRGERVVDAAVLTGLALAADPAYQGARVVSIQTAAQRRAEFLAAVRAQLEHGQAAADEARKKYAPPVDVAKLLAVKWDPGLADQHVSADAMALAAHYGRPI